MSNKRILIIDDAGFSKICSAILESEGYRTETVVYDGPGRAADMPADGDYGLVITSYPFANGFVSEVQRRRIPTMILATHIDVDLIGVLEGFRESYCMIKPLDYQKFTSVVRQMMSGDLNIQGGYNIV